MQSFLINESVTTNHFVSNDTYLSQGRCWSIMAIALFKLINFFQCGWFFIVHPVVRNLFQFFFKLAFEVHFLARDKLSWIFSKTFFVYQTLANLSKNFQKSRNFLSANVCIIVPYEHEDSAFNGTLILSLKKKDI